MGAQSTELAEYLNKKIHEWKNVGYSVFLSVSTQAQAQQMAQMFLLPSIFLSGYIFPAEGLPFILRWIGRFFPATHMIAILRGVILRSAGLGELMPNILALCAISAVLIYGSVRSFRKVAL